MALSNIAGTYYVYSFMALSDPAKSIYALYGYNFIVILNEAGIYYVYSFMASPNLTESFYA